MKRLNVHGYLTIFRGQIKEEIVLEQQRLFTVIDLITFLFPYLEIEDMLIVQQLINKRRNKQS